MRVPSHRPGRGNPSSGTSRRARRGRAAGCSRSRPGGCSGTGRRARLPGYSPDLMPVEALWRWLREDVTDHHCHACAEDLTRRVADFEARLNQDPFVVADRLWTEDRLDPEEEKLRFSK